MTVHPHLWLHAVLGEFIENVPSKSITRSDTPMVHCSERTIDSRYTRTLENVLINTQTRPPQKELTNARYKAEYMRTWTQSREEANIEHNNKLERLLWIMSCVYACIGAGMLVDAFLAHLLCPSAAAMRSEFAGRFEGVKPLRNCRAFQ